MCACVAALSEAVALYREAQAMMPEPNKPLTDLDTLSGSTQAGQAAGLVGVQVFGSSSLMDDMAFAAAWLAVATGACVGRQHAPVCVVTHTK